MCESFDVKVYDKQMIVKGIKNVANINKLPLNTIYTNSCVHFGFQLITVTAILYSHMAETTKQPPPKKKNQCQSDPQAVTIL